MNALHCAITEGATTVIPLLLALGADPTRPNENGQTPLELAEASGMQESVNLIRAALGITEEDKL